MSANLPEGPRGRVLAAALTVAALGALWAGVASPLIGWYADREDRLEARQTLARRMDAIAASLPELRREAGAETDKNPTEASLLGGASDAIAAARLQEILQGMAAQAGAVFSSLETLPTEQGGNYRRIALRVSMNAPWPVLIGLLRSIETNTPSLLVDDLRLEGSRMIVRAGGESIDAVFTVVGFRSASEAASAGEAAATGTGAAGTVATGTTAAGTVATGTAK